MMEAKLKHLLPDTWSKLRPGLLDFYGAFSFSPSSLLLNWFGSFFLAFCSSIWLTTGYYGLRAFWKMTGSWDPKGVHTNGLAMFKGKISKKIQKVSKSEVICS